MKTKIIIILSIFILSGCGNKDIIEEETFNKNKTIVTLGDSLTAGYGVGETENYPYKLKEVLNQNGYNYEVINGGISGDTSLDLKNRVYEYLVEDPEIVIIAIGANDGLKGKSIDDMKDNILEIIDLFLENNTKVVISGMDTTITYGLSYRSNFKDAYEEIKKQREEIYFHKYFLKGVILKPKYNLDDNIHPNNDGYDIITSEIFEFLEDEKIIKK